MFYEVHIPLDQGAATRTLQVVAHNWRAAYRAAVAQNDDEDFPSHDRNFAHLFDDRVVVTDPAKRRVVTVRRVQESDVRQSQVLDLVAPKSPPPARPTPVPGTGPVLAHPSTGRSHTIVSTEIRVASGPVGTTGRVVADTVEPSGRAAVADDGGRPESVSESALEDVFMEITTLFEPDFEMSDAIDFVLELVVRNVPSASGGVVFASDDADHLYFAAARGDGAQSLLRAELSIIDGLPAASLRDGVTIAMASSAGDRRHTPELADVGGIEVESLCAAPIQAGPRAFGVLLLVNRSDRSFYTRYDANVATYVAAQLGRYIQEQVDAAPLD